MECCSVCLQWTDGLTLCLRSEVQNLNGAGELSVVGDYSLLRGSFGGSVRIVQWTALDG